MGAIKAIPEQGQLVKVRHRLYVVTDVRQTTLPAGVLFSKVTPAQHLVLLSSIEDDGLGEELQVIWELEPGTQVFERVELPKPTGFDDPARLDAFLDAVRWGAASSADIRTLQAPFRSGIDIEDYQLDPVVRAIQMPRVNLLIADDVGLGKTIEAGLVAQELLIRHRCRRMLIICPSSLQIQWRDQMRDKFGLDFRIVDSNLMKDLRRQRGIHVNPWIHFPRLITSIDFLKRDRPLRLFREVLPAEGESIYPRRFNLLIVDEAHNVAPSGSGQYAIDSQRTATIRLLVPHFEHKLFLTATPHNGYPESFTALLELLDTQRFARGVEPDRNQLQVVMVRRLKQEMKDFDNRPMFPVRKLDAITVDYSQPERQAHVSLKRYTELRTKGVDDNVEKYATEFVLKLLKKCLFSSPEAFLTTLTQHQESLTTARRRQANRLSAKPTEGILRRQLEQVEEDFADDDLYEAATDESISNTSRLFRALAPEEQDLLREMLQWAEIAALNCSTGLIRSFAPINNGQGHCCSALGAMTNGTVPEVMQQRLAQLWDKSADSLMQALEVRKGERSTSLQQDSRDRAEKEIADITAILTELQKSILKELQEPPVEQLELFSNPEREQFERNMNSLKARAEQIPREIEQETALIRKRFENPTARLFPLAVTFLVPQRFV